MRRWRRRMRAAVCSPRARQAALLSAAMAAAFLAIGVASSLGLSEALDRRALSALRGQARPWLTHLMLGITMLGAWPVVAAGVLGFAWWDRRGPRRDVVLLAATCIGAALLSLSLKLLFQRPRPNLLPPLVAVGGFGFPSGHALLSLAFYGTVGHVVACRTAPPWRAWLVRVAAGLAVVCIGVSRVYLGVHYLSDVLAGYATALAWVSALALLRAMQHRPRGLAEDAPGV